MRVLVMASGSYGDINPFLAIGREMKRRGHDVLFFASAYFASAAREAGLPFVPVGPVEAYEVVIRNPDLVRPGKGFKLVAGATMEYLPEAHRLLEERVQPGQTILIGSTLAFATRLVQERRGVPTVTAHLAPSIFRSAYVSPRMTESGIFERFPPALKRMAWRVVDALIVDPVFCREFNRYRTELGLRPVKRMFHDWIHQADLTLGLFPAWFASPQPDWPAGVHLTDFPLYDQAGTNGLAADVQDFLESGAPPVVFTTGTATTTETRFFSESAEACVLANKRGMLLTPFAEQVPDRLPPTVRRFDHVPFSQLLPRVGAVVHHGGIGTSSQALAAGVAQLLRPMAFDQFDNAWRLETLGVARSLTPKRYRAHAVAAALDELMSSQSVQASCRLAAERLAGRQGVSRTCDIILEKAARQSI